MTLKLQTLTFTNGVRTNELYCQTQVAIHKHLLNHCSTLIERLQENTDEELGVSESTDEPYTIYIGALDDIDIRITTESSMLIVRISNETDSNPRVFIYKQDWLENPSPIRTLLHTLKLISVHIASNEWDHYKPVGSFIYQLVNDLEESAKT